MGEQNKFSVSIVFTPQLERFSYDLELKTRYIHLRNNWAQGCSSGDPLPARCEEQKVWLLARGRRASLARFFATFPFRKPLLYHHTQWYE